MKATLRLMFALAIWGCTSFAQESGEVENLHFTYEAATHMMVISRQASCYLFTLTDAELAQVHSDAALSQLELSFLAKLSDPNVVMHKLPHNLLHTHLIKECGHGITQYFVIEQ